MNSIVSLTENHAHPVVSDSQVQFWRTRVAAAPNEVEAMITANDFANFIWERLGCGEKHLAQGMARAYLR